MEFVNSEYISGHTGLLGLLGSPVKHSVSPMMHNLSFRILGLDYVYLCFEADESTLKKTVDSMVTLNARGFNLTMPNKNLMPQFCDELSLASQISGAVNTVINDNGVLTGTTTDGIGFMRSVESEGYDILGKKMTLFGTGGVATAMATQAAIDGVSEIAIYGIKDKFYDRAIKVVNDLNERTECKVSLNTYDDDNKLRNDIKESAVVANGTSVGMAPNTDACILSDSSYFEKDQLVYDVIYNPRETKFLKLAKDAGCNTLNGMYMLLYQGARSFELWTGREMPVDEVKKACFNA